MLVSIDFIVWNDKLTLDDRDEVGFELAGLGSLPTENVDILRSIILTPMAFRHFLKENNLSLQIKHLLGSINYARHDSLTQIASYINGLVEHGVLDKKIVDPLFKNIEHLDSKKLSIHAYYFQGNKLIGKHIWNDIIGEAVLVEHIRIAWSHLFAPENLKRHTIHSKNHESFSVCLAIVPKIEFSLTGIIKTVGNTKSDYEIEAHSMVKYVYNKHSKIIHQGHVFAGGDKNALSPTDIKKLLSYAHAAEKLLYLPQVLPWGKINGKFLVTKVIPATDAIEYHDTYSLLTDHLTVTPGITIGRLKVINEKEKEIIITNDEIVMLKSLSKELLTVVKRAKGIIIEENPNPEVTFLLKSFGIPTVIRKKHHMLYSTGDIISLNATTGEIKRGNMLVS